mgnify:CR=1 FL=1
MILALLSIEPPTVAADSEMIRARFRRGDREVWDRLVHDEHGRVFNLHLRLIGDREAAADLTQDTFAEAWRCPAPRLALRSGRERQPQLAAAPGPA